MGFLLVLFFSWKKSYNCHENRIFAKPNPVNPLTRQMRHMKTNFLLKQAWTAGLCLIGGQAMAATLPTDADTGRALPLKLWYNRPATFFEESLPVGNGRLGALVYGGVADNLIYLNDITLWTGQPVNPDLGQGAAQWIPKIRQALYAGNYQEADRLQRHVQGPNSQYYQPLGTLHILDTDTTAASAYYRELDIDSALCRDRYTRGGVTYTREYFASHPDQVIAIHIKADRAGAVNCSVTLSAQTAHRVKASRGNAQLTMTGHVTGPETDATHYCTVLSARTTDGTVTAADSTLTISGATEATLYLVNETSFNGFDRHPVRQAAPYIERAADDAWHLVNHTYQDLRTRHVADYRQLFGRFSLSLGGSRLDTTRTTEQQLRDYTDRGGRNPYLETLYTQYGRYLLISSSRTAGVPANLQGLWAPKLQSPWRGNYTMNINLEENYWPAEVANLPEMVMPLDSFVYALSQNGRHTAQNYYGIGRGWCASHNSDIWAMTNPVGENRESPKWSNWNMGGAWLVNTLWEHYLFGQDKTYLKQTAYPLMKGAAAFCLDWLTDNPRKPGELITAPSTSPEAEYITDKGYQGCTLYGGTADLAIIRELLTNTLAAAQTLGTDKTLRREISQALTRLHPYQTGKRGNLQEWYDDWDDQDWQHRHQSHLIGLYPGHHLTDPILKTAAAKSLDIKGDQTTGWSTGWRINLWARLHQPEKAYHIFQKLLTYVSPDNYRGPGRRRSGGTYPNLFDAHPPFQIDGNFGGTAGVCEMLVQSADGIIELLPALPAAWPEGHVTGIRARGGYTLNMTWRNGRITTVTLLPKVSGKVSVRYNGKEEKLKLKAGQPVTLTD